jgi:hypothetical protein
VVDPDVVPYDIHRGSLIEQMFYSESMVKRPANHTKPKPRRVVRHVWIHEPPLTTYQGLLIGTQARNGVTWAYVALIELEQSEARLVCRWVNERVVTYVPSEPGDLPY